MILFHGTPYQENLMAIREKCRIHKNHKESLEEIHSRGSFEQNQLCYCSTPSLPAFKLSTFSVFHM